MRAAPCGLFPSDDAFGLGVMSAAITHSHPSGYLPAGVLAGIIAQILEGSALEQATFSQREILTEWSGCLETLDSLDQVLDLVQSTPLEVLESMNGSQHYENIKTLGEGWTGEEALAIALYCAWVGTSFVHATSLAASHSGDSDSTAAICGNIYGALHGIDSLPNDWLETLELRNAIEQLAAAIFEHHKARSKILI
jgi:ADP-ribosylglycohydrolase